MKHIHIMVAEDGPAEETLQRYMGALFAKAETLLPAADSGGLNERVRGAVLTLGISAHLKGYQYLVEAVSLAALEPERLDRLTKDLYPAVAERFGITPSKVERAIRHAIETAWQRGRVEQINQYFGCRVISRTDKPTSGELIALLTEQVRRETRRK